MPTSSLTPAVLEAIARTLERAYPQEGCGIVVDTPRGVRVLASPNGIAAQEGLTRTRGRRSPARGYVLDVRLIVAAERAGERLLVIFHSHPDALPHFSAEDAARACVDLGDGPTPAFPGVAHLVTKVQRGRALESRLYQYTRDGFAEVARYRHACVDAPPW